MYIRLKMFASTVPKHILSVHKQKNYRNKQIIYETNFGRFSFFIKIVHKSVYVSYVIFFSNPNMLRICHIKPSSLDSLYVFYSIATFQKYSRRKQNFCEFKRSDILYWLSHPWGCEYVNSSLSFSRASDLKLLHSFA